MSLPDETLRKILAQIQQTAAQSQKALQLASAQKTSKQREQRAVQLTVRELSAVGPDVPVYKGVGKAFMQIPRPQMDADLRAQERDLADTITSIAKKEKYLEKQFNEAQGQLRDIFNSANRQ